LPLSAYEEPKKELPTKNEFLPYISSWCMQL
jgi:hypothetical protein